MVQRGAAVYEEGSHLEKLYYAFTYCIFCDVNVVRAYNLLVRILPMHSCQVERLACLKACQMRGQGWMSSSLIACARGIETAPCRANLERRPGR